MSGGEVPGVDLARLTLRAALEAARKNGNTRTAKPKPLATSAIRRDGREPMGLGAAIGVLVTERACELPAAGATAAVVGGHRPRVRRARRGGRLRRGLRPAHRVSGVGGLGDEDPAGAGRHHRGRQHVGGRDGRTAPADPRVRLRTRA
ncbi:hypothetical protein QFZ76_010286 [Streptomyces sp. V4I2]|nr:hypothetical protein [Streptomyces sp. V4I2]